MTEYYSQRMFPILWYYAKWKMVSFNHVFLYVSPHDVFLTLRRRLINFVIPVTRKKKMNNLFYNVIMVDYSVAFCLKIPWLPDTSWEVLLNRHSFLNHCLDFIIARRKWLCCIRQNQNYDGMAHGWLDLKQYQLI